MRGADGAAKVTAGAAPGGPRRTRGRGRRAPADRGADAGEGRARPRRRRRRRARASTGRGRRSDENGERAAGRARRHDRRGPRARRDVGRRRRAARRHSVKVLERIRGNRLVRLVSLGLTILVALLAAAIVVSITVDLGPAARNAAETYGSK